jgi:hypothetical protein
MQAWSGYCDVIGKYRARDFTFQEFKLNILKLHAQGIIIAYVQDLGFTD